MYKIDPARTDLAQEFKRRPLGPHSAELQKILNVMRWQETAGKYVLVCTKPHREWCLAQLSGKRGAPIKLFEDVTFDDIGRGEWHIFKLRWQGLTGQEIPFD